MKMILLTTMVILFFGWLYWYFVKVYVALGKDVLDEVKKQ